MVDARNTVNVPVPGSSRFEYDTAMAISRLKASLGPDSTPSFTSATFSGLTASRLVSADAAKTLTSVASLSSWVAGTANEIDVADDGDGTITIGIVNPLIVSKGGTGVATLTTAYGLLAAGTTATGAVQTLPAGLTTQILVGGGASALPAWGADLPTAVTIGTSYIYRAGGTDVPVADGGTGASTLTDHGLLLGSGTDAITPLGVATHGQLPIGSTGADPVLATLTAGSGISVTNGAGTITIAAVASGISHNSLSGLQGGTAAEYYHLTSAQYSALHAAVTIPVSANGLVLTGQEISLPVTATPTFVGITLASAATASALFQWTNTNGYGELAFKEGTAYMGFIGCYGSVYGGEDSGALTFTSGLNNTGTIQFKTLTSSSYVKRLSISNAGVINVPGLTASQLVATDASKNLVSQAVGGVSHNDLGSLQGGTAGEYYHLTNAQVSALHAAVTLGTLTGITLSGQQLSLTSGYVIPTTTQETNWNSAYSASHTRQHSITSTSDHTSAATSGKMLKADASGLPIDASNTDIQVAAAVTASHAAVTIPVSANGLVLAGQEISFPTSATPTFAGLTISSSTPNQTTFESDGNYWRSEFIAYNSDLGSSPQIVMRKAAGSKASPSAIGLNNYIFDFLGFGYGATAWSTLAKLRLSGVAAENWTDSAQGTYWSIAATPTGSTTRAEIMRITGNGPVGIGTIAPDKQLEINSATGACLRLTYNDSNGTAANRVDYEVTSGGNGTITPSGGVLSLTGSLYPATDNTYYLGKNDDDTPFAWKGLILKDQAGTGKYYRLEVYGDALRIVDLTD